MTSINPNLARGFPIAVVFALALGLMIETTGAREPFVVVTDDEYGPMMFKRLKEIGGGPKGFTNELAGAKWGAPLAGFPHMKLVENMGATRSTNTNGRYRNGDERLTVNGATVSQARYWFADKQLGSVSLGYKGREQWYKLKQWAEKVYGPLERPGVNTQRWDAKLQQFVRERRTVSEMPTDGAWSGELLWTSAATQARLMWHPKMKAGELLIISAVLEELHAFEGVGPGDC